MVLPNNKNISTPLNKTASPVNQGASPPVNRTASPLRNKTTSQVKSPVPENGGLGSSPLFAANQSSRRTPKEALDEW